MRIAVHGQQAFGKAVLEKLLEKGEDVVAVFCAPAKEGRPQDPLAELAAAKGLPLHQPKSWKTPEAYELMATSKPDVCMMAYVTLFVPQNVLDAPKQGTFQYHPSLLPRHRGPSSINWPIIQGETKTGLTIFWPDEGLDEGPILLQKEVDIGPDDTLGSLYFNRLFPMGVDAMIEALDLVRTGKAPKIPQDHSKATYESWCRKANAAVDWSKPTADVYNLIRGCDPQPGAWTTRGGAEVQLFDSRHGEGSGAPGTVLGVSGDGVTVATSDGAILVKRVRAAGGGKIAASEWASAAGVKTGESLGS
ncbi:MAG: methionyl-tRNA formyltransferase [Propylenella sp.]